MRTTSVEGSGRDWFSIFGNNIHDMTVKVLAMQSFWAVGEEVTSEQFVRAKDTDVREVRMFG